MCVRLKSEIYNDGFQFNKEVCVKKKNRMMCWLLEKKNENYVFNIQTGKVGYDRLKRGNLGFFFSLLL